MRRGLFHGRGCLLLSLVVMLWLVLGVGLAVCAEEAGSVGGEVAAELSPAKFRVRGYGLLGNRRLAVNMRVLRPQQSKYPYLGGSTVEDAALLLLATVQQDGYLRPRIDVELRLGDGTLRRYPCEVNAAERFEVPSDLLAREVLFQIHPGVLYTFDRLDFEGLAAMSEAVARSYFVIEDFVIRQRGTRVFSESRLRRGLSNLREELVRLGYGDAEVEVESEERDHESGRVDVVVRVREGVRRMVEATEVRVRDVMTNEVSVVRASGLREPYSRLWEQRWVRGLKAPLYKEGYADAKVEVGVAPWSEGGLEQGLEVTALIDRGPVVRVAKVKTEGLFRTRESVVERRIRFGEGDPLNPAMVEEARFQMLRLGIFDRVDVEYRDTGTEGLREVTFQVEESKPLSLSLLAGYGSYELLRAGAEFEQVDLFGLAHRHRLLAVQSFKSTKAEYGYTIPQVFDSLGDLTAIGYYRRREETTFVRRDFGGSLGYSRYVPQVLADVGIRYSYERLETEDDNFNPAYGLQQANVSSIGLTFDRNRSDNPLYPTSGHRMYATAEYADDRLGGGARYGRFEVGGSWHVPLSRMLVFHSGLAHSVILVPGEASEYLPFNRRFFLGGATSVRGFTQGEAASRDAEGKLVGDESTTVGHLELEQRLTHQWSVVVFMDGAGMARDMTDYPAGDYVVTVGGGIRYRSPVGPVRLEYGHNVKRRSGDVDGTLHFSIGYPF